MLCWEVSRLAETAVKSGVNANTAVIPEKKHKYGLKEISGRLLEISKGQRGFIAFATIASIVGNLSQMGLMGFGAAFILSCAGSLPRGTPGVGEQPWRSVPCLSVLCGI